MLVATIVLMIHSSTLIFCPTVNKRALTKVPKSLYQMDSFQSSSHLLPQHSWGLFPPILHCPGGVTPSPCPSLLSLLCRPILLYLDFNYWNSFAHIRFSSSYGVSHTYLWLQILSTLTTSKSLFLTLSLFSA